MDWLDILKIHKGLSFFFDVSVPAAIEKNACFGHVLLVCPDAAIRNHFSKELHKQLAPLAVSSPAPIGTETVLLEEEVDPTIGLRNLYWDSECKCGDLGAVLTNMRPRDLLLLNCEETDLLAKCSEMLCDAMDSFGMDLIIGKGPSARSIRLDLPEFTFVACVARETEDVKKFESHFAYVIKIDKNELIELCEKTAIMKAQGEGYSLTDEACAYLSKCADCDCMAAENYTARVIEYMRHYYAVGTQITEEHAKDIMGKLGIYPKDKNDRQDNNDEMHVLLREIRKRLDDIQKTVAELKNSVEEIKGEEGFSSLSEIGRSLETIEESLS